jgi:hypothetical protein
LHVEPSHWKHETFISIVKTKTPIFRIWTNDLPRECWISIVLRSSNWTTMSSISSCIYIAY